MLRLHRAHSASAIRAYFSTADYYSQGNETVGRFGGKLAERWGVTGMVTKEAFDRLTENLHPVTGEKLTQRTVDNRRIGEDMIFSLPKDVGAYIMLLPDAEREAALEMVERRVTQVMELIEGDVQTRVRKDGAFENRSGEGLIWAGFRHTTSRPVMGPVGKMLPPDPHPHWHMFGFNATYDPVENRIKAADFSNIYRDRSFYEAVFYSMVSKDFADAGLAVERRADGKWGFKGLQKVGELFSKRTKQIEEAAERLGIENADEKDRLGAKTRARKDTELSPTELQQAWIAQLSEADREALGKIYAGAVGRDRPPTAKEAVEFALDHLSENQSVFALRDLERAALLYGVGAVSLAEIDAEIPRQGVIVGEIDGRVFASTAKLQSEERFLTGFAADGRGTVDPIGVSEELTPQLDEKHRLNEGQWNAVVNLLNSTNRVNLFLGPAGAGKSYSLQKLDEGVRDQGGSVRYLASSSDAAKSLENDGFEVNTLAHFLVDKRMQEATRGGLVVLDEAGLCGHADAVRFFKLAQQLDLRILLTGDPAQHSSVGRGALLRIMEEYAGVKPFRLTEIMRQQNTGHREAAHVLSQGETLQAFDMIDQQLGWIKQVEGDERYQQIAAEYVQSLAEKKSTLVISPTHAEAALITDEIRKQLREAGKLDKEERVFTRLVPVNATEAERRLAETYQQGDVLEFHKNAKGFTRGQRVIIDDPAAVPFAHAGAFQLYRPEQVGLAKGDEIRMTASVSTCDDKKRKLKNGEHYSVAGFKRGKIVLSNGKEIAADAGHWRRGFVETSFGAQGRTTQRVILGVSSSSLPAVNQEMMYVASTRAKEKMTIYCDDKEAIREGVLLTSQKVAALDLESGRPLEAKQREREQRQELHRRREAHARTREAQENERKAMVRQHEREVGRGR